MPRYKIEIVKMGAYLAMLYEKKHWWSRWKHIGQCLDNNFPYSQWVIDMQEKYQIPAKRITFELTDIKTITPK